MVHHNSPTSLGKTFTSTIRLAENPQTLNLQIALLDRRLVGDQYNPDISVSVETQDTLRGIPEPVFRKYGLNGEEVWEAALKLSRPQAQTNNGQPDGGAEPEGSPSQVWRRSLEQITDPAERQVVEQLWGNMGSAWLNPDGRLHLHEPYRLLDSVASLIQSRGADGLALTGETVHSLRLRHKEIGMKVDPDYQPDRAIRSGNHAETASPCCVEQIVQTVERHSRN